jgi:phosphomannomutase
MGAFHAYDIRGIYPTEINREFAYKAGYFIPELLEADKVLVGRDMRTSTLSASSSSGMKYPAL